MIVTQEPKSQCVTCRLTSETLGNIMEEALKRELSLSGALELNIKKAFRILFEEIPGDDALNE